MAQRFRKLPARCRAYVLATSAVGLAIAAHSLSRLLVQQVDSQWLILAALTLLTGTFTVRIPGINARLSVSDTFVFASVLLFGPAAGTITVLLDALIISLRLGHHTREPFRVIFNVSVAALSTWLSAQIFFAVAQIPPYSVTHTPLGQILFPLFLFTLSYFLSNSWLVTFALALEKGRSPHAIWRANFLWLSVNYFGGASVAGLLVAYTKAIDLTTLGIIVPLLLISYLTFKTSLGRIEDANKHLMEVNQLYLSTIETLAMAIDAKDQVTHGHIRRVQRYTVGLARSLGVTDEKQIKAIEAAALLHDMGKLGIPEFILNKPGRLTPNEFEVMKQHTNIGADILSSIQFPYAVVPIVRHHHENWNGSGYPDKLKGVAIPLGARILSVVDCFDALTSDRPYRPALSIEDALKILIERRGSMYDPLVVDKFVAAHPELSKLISGDDLGRDAISSIAARLRLPSELPKPQPQDVHEPVPLAALSLLRSLKVPESGASLDDLGTLLSARIASLTGATSVAIYRVNSSGHAVRCRYCSGPLEWLAGSYEIPLGDKLSGWVAAHRTPIWNSDASLDINPEAAGTAAIGLASSIPLVDGEALVGVLTLYAPIGKEVGVEQRLLLQSSASLVASAVAAAIRRQDVASFEATDSPSRELVYTVLDAQLSRRADRTNPEGIRIVLVTAASQRKSSGEWSATMTAIAAAASEYGYAIKVSELDLLVVSRSRDFPRLGIELGSGATEARRREYQAREVHSSLELRELLGLTLTPGSARAGAPLVH